MGLVHQKMTCNIFKSMMKCIKRGKSRSAFEWNILDVIIIEHMEEGITLVASLYAVMITYR